MHLHAVKLVWYHRLLGWRLAVALGSARGPQGIGPAAWNDGASVCRLKLSVEVPPACLARFGPLDPSVARTPLRELACDVDMSGASALVALVSHTSAYSATSSLRNLVGASRCPLSLKPGPPILAQPVPPTLAIAPVPCPAHPHIPCVSEHSPVTLGMPFCPQWLVTMLCNDVPW